MQCVQIRESSAQANRRARNDLSPLLPRVHVKTLLEILETEIPSRGARVDRREIVTD